MTSSCLDTRHDELLPPPPTGWRARVRAVAAAGLFRRAAARLPLRAEFPDGTVLGRGAHREPLPRMIIHDPAAFHARLGQSGLIGFGESYTAGEWTAPDPAAVLTVLACQMPRLVPAALQRFRTTVLPKPPAGELGTTANARTNIEHHYDLSNELFQLFLDDSMTYSAALFPEADLAANTVHWELLHDAQHRKIDRLLDAAGVRAGSRVLEIGTGWGELAVRAAARGALVHSVTLSTRQLESARERVTAAGYADRAHIELCDYRDIRGEFDAIVSVEMIEAVGYRYWPAYFECLDRLLRPGGRVALQAITMPHERMLATRDTYTWIQKYIFPGGFLPSAEAIEDTVTRETSLRVRARSGFGAHYAETLRLWRERFDAHAAEIDVLGFDARFRRLWQFYLAYSEAGFRSGYLDVQHIVLDRPEEHP
ncbi:class I SAM-dependent methyltransferase [Nocardia sp. 2]|uniref:Class I SAM-dependent methyltransferase n=1 Tax=Nocardia acididurans TaxID=2802282 RepID=A0ABS1M927_9NOCA|nr:class I SAM-dependent methyltransferase [Nocardia acididurans]MBL1077150.1 class I SAM-dependent methyltransferase [Nocardia acididurans]